MLHRFLAAEGLRPDDPTGDLEGVRVPAGLPKPLAEAEVASLLDAVTGSDPVALRDRALLELLYATGARISEVCGLSIGDVDLEHPHRPPVRQGCQGAAGAGGSRGGAGDGRVVGRRRPSPPRTDPVGTSRRCRRRCS
jgi:integrase